MAEACFYGFFTASRPRSSPFLRTTGQTSVIHLTLELFMDLAFIAIATGLWGLMVLLVWGFQKLERPLKGRS
ncbi:hypothetical protein [Polaromonas sp.]|uniref:hypothetical protein n=1 Tax=Polaromonas sp. TaxID=1869339 RepID=UPI0017A717F7|nr:hypothetical protein [Polaromonas sp.]NMM07679.1 hypothetical protein [Polaromonas sp.]